MFDCPTVVCRLVEHRLITLQGPQAQYQMIGIDGFYLAAMDDSFAGIRFFVSRVSIQNHDISRPKVRQEIIFLLRDTQGNPVDSFGRFMTVLQRNDFQVTENIPGLFLLLQRIIPNGSETAPLLFGRSDFRQDMFLLDKGKETVKVSPFQIGCLLNGFQQSSQLRLLVTFPELIVNLPYIQILRSQSVKKRSRASFTAQQILLDHPIPHFKGLKQQFRGRPFFHQSILILRIQEETGDFIIPQVIIIM